MTRKQLYNSYIPENEIDIFTSFAVTEKMYEHWNIVPDRIKFDNNVGSRIWKDIQRDIIKKTLERKSRLYKFVAQAAVFLLLLGITSFTWIYYNKETSVSNYIVHSGIKNISTIRLPDGTIVKIGSGSELVYPAEFRGEKREIWLDGQAFFDVIPDIEKPFVVHTPYMDIEALGTAFEIFAYHKNDYMETILLNGKIAVNLQNRKDTTFILMPDDKITYNKLDDKVILSRVIAEKYTSWSEGIISFENEKLSMIIPRLEKWYGCVIIIDKELGESYRFTFKTRDEPLERILYLMGESSPLRYKKSNSGDFILYENK